VDLKQNGYIGNDTFLSIGTPLLPEPYYFAQIFLLGRNLGKLDIHGVLTYIFAKFR
jgi:hypothetical protein